MKGSHALKKEFNFFSVLKIIFVLAIIGGIIFGIVWAIKNNIENAENEKIIREVIDTSFTSIKNLDKENIHIYLDYNKLISGLDENLIKENKDTELEKELFKNISWSIESITVKTDEAIVIIEVTNKSFKNILMKWTKYLIETYNDTEQIAQDTAINELEKILKNEKERKTELKKVRLKKYENNWKIEVNDDLIDLLYPGIDSVTRILK